MDLPRGDHHPKYERPEGCHTNVGLSCFSPYLPIRQLFELHHFLVRSGQPRLKTAFSGERSQASKRQPSVTHAEHTVGTDVRDVRAHYDLPDEFFGLFLDEARVYSCAYFAHRDDSLENAQRRKLELTCQKLQLQPDSRFLDVGCGWGALLLHAARHYGTVSEGITLSKKQLRYVNDSIVRSGLDQRVHARLAHYASIEPNSYDQIASIGMYEHVGLSSYDKYFGRMYRALRPGGLLLNHGITLLSGDTHLPGIAFLFRHVFPGCELATVGQTTVAIENAGFEIIDVQSLQPHYALTLENWRRRYVARREEAARLVGEQVLRRWDLYLPGCAQAFAEGSVGIYQVLAAKLDAQGRSRAPFTREAIRV